VGSCRLGPELVRNHVVLTEGARVDAAAHAFKIFHELTVAAAGRSVKFPLRK
jgi:hypothetical protein